MKSRSPLKKKVIFKQIRNFPLLDLYFVYAAYSFFWVMFNLKLIVKIIFLTYAAILFAMVNFRCFLERKL